MQDWKTVALGERAHVTREGTDYSQAFSHQQRNRIRSLVPGLRVEFLNLLPPSPIIGLWQVDKARLAARIFVDGLADQRAVLLCCGTRVARAVVRALGCGYPTQWGLLTSGGPHGRLYVTRIPHPSGRCRVWNDPDDILRIRKALEDEIARVVGEVPGEAQ